MSRVDPVFVVTSGCRWGKYVTEAYPDQAAKFADQAASLGYCRQETHRMWRIADRTVAEEYFAVTEKVEALYEQAAHAHGQHAVLPADAAGQNMRVLRNETVKRLLGNGYCGRPRELDCQYETICESCTMFFTTIAHRDTIQAQRDDAAEQGHDRRRDVYDAVLTKLDDTPA